MCAASLGLRVIAVHPYSSPSPFSPSSFPLFLPFPSVCQFTHPPVNLSIRQPIHLFIHPPIHPSHSLPFPLSLSFLVSPSCLLRICFESTVGAFLNNLLLFDIWSELSTFWHKFAVVHDGERIAPAFSESRPGVLQKRSVFGAFLGRYDRSQPQISAIFSKIGTWFGLRWPVRACCGGIRGRCCGN